MIEKISRGFRIGGLIRYLMGPGRFNEHTEQRVIASWDGRPAEHQPRVIGALADGPGGIGDAGEDVGVRDDHAGGGQFGAGEAGGASGTASGVEFDVTDLVWRLSQPAQAGGVALAEPPASRDGELPQGPVWHCSLRNHAEDRVLTDEEWAQVVADVLDATGIAPHGDQRACRWVAIRHAPDHVHIAAVLVREDTGKRVRPYRDWPQTRAVVKAAELRLGITVTASADRTAVRQSTRAELEKAALRGAGETTRAWLRRSARLAAVRAQDPEGYFLALRGQGIRVRKRVSATTGELQGYALGWRHDVTGDDREPVWFSGGALAKDLTLPKLMSRWASATVTPQIPPAPDEHSKVGAVEQADAVAEAMSAIDHATAAYASGDDDGEVAAIAHATEDLLVALTMLTGDIRDPAPRGGPADVYQRAARREGIGQPTSWGPIASQLRTAAWRLAAVGTLGRRGRAGSGAELMVAAAALIAEIATWHEQSRRLAQARAARVTHEVITRRPAGRLDASRGPASRSEQDRTRSREPRRGGEEPRHTTPPSTIAAAVRHQHQPGDNRRRRR
jgi:hypothetical protein